MATRYTGDGERLRRALFRGLRYGGFGLVRDLQDLLTLATLVHGCWMGVSSQKMWRTVVASP